MIEFYDRNYGADADGRRGCGVWFYELDESDKPQIIEQLKDQLIGVLEDAGSVEDAMSFLSGRKNRMFTVTLQSRSDDDIDFEVDLYDNMDSNEVHHYFDELWNILC